MLQDSAARPDATSAQFALHTESQTCHDCVSQVDDTILITPCIDNLAKVLVENLTGRSGNPELALLADRLLHSMVARFPKLLWSAQVIQALLVELQREEGAFYLTGGKPRLTLARVLRIRRKKKKVPLPAWTWLIKVKLAKQPASLQLFSCAGIQLPWGWLSTCLMS